MSNSNNKFSPLQGKEPWLAVNLSMLLPGLGQFYCGKIIRGLIFSLSFLILIAIGFYSFILTSETILVLAIFLFLIGLVFFINLFDAYYSAKRENSDAFNQERKKIKILG